MKLIIEIPDRIHFGIEKGFCVNGSDASQIVLDAIKNSTPIPDNATVCDIEQIRDEISAILTNSYDEGVKEKALQIIDKYR